MTTRPVTFPLFISLVCSLTPVSFTQETVKKQLETLYPKAKGNISKTPDMILVCLSDKIPATVVPTVVEVAYGPASLTHVTLEIANGAIKGTTGGPLHAYLEKGELLRLSIRNVQKDYVEFGLHTLTPQTITEGQQALQGPAGTRFLDKSPRVLYSQVKFYFPRALLEGKDVAPITSEIEKWFKPFKDKDSALAFVKANAGASVPEIKIGMTLAEVEKVLGAPEQRFTFPDKLVYKYKGFTIEFRDNVVTDIKY